MSQNAPAAPRQSATRTALAGLIGNILEWFDFGVYSFFATEIGEAFFPSTDHTAQLLKAYVVLAIGFAFRPIGSIVLGRVGDHIGRRALLTVSVGIMGAATLALGLLPSYAAIGTAAPVLLVVLRCIQGFSLGGEFTGSMVYTTELASPRARGLISSSTAAGTTIGFMLGSASAWLTNSLLTKAEIVSWGWRVPFICSVVLCIAGWFLRRGVHEPEQGKTSAALRVRIWPSIKADWLPIVRTFGIVSMTNAGYYFAFTFALDQHKGRPDTADFFKINTLCLFAVLAGKVLGGWLSDRVGRRRLMLLLTVVMMVLVFVTVPWMLYGEQAAFAAGQIILGFPLGMALGLQGAMVVEIFPLRTRVTSMSLAYSVTLALSGGIVNLISTWLLGTFGPRAPEYYIVFYGIVGLLLMLPMSETNNLSLDTTIAEPDAAEPPLVAHVAGKAD